MNKRGNFLMLVELILVTVIVLILARRMLTTTMIKPVLDQPTQKMAEDAGINTQNYQTVIQSTKQTVRNLEEEHQKYMDQVEKGLK
jgi:hypothetical protein